MTTIIYKYPITIHGVQHVSMPKAAKILCAKSQLGSVCLWAENNITDLVNYPEVFDVHIFESRFTGEESSNGGTYIGSVQVEGYVTHVYEITAKEDAKEK